MKKVVMISLSLLFFVFAGNDLKAQEKNEKYGHVILKCDMKCGICAEKITKQLTYTSGVKDVKADFVKDEVWIKYKKKKTDATKLIASLDEIDYKASVKGAEKKHPCPHKKKVRWCKEKAM